MGQTVAQIEQPLWLPWKRAWLDKEIYLHFHPFDWRESICKASTHLLGLGYHNFFLGQFCVFQQQLVRGKRQIICGRSTVWWSSGFSLCIDSIHLKLCFRQRSVKVYFWLQLCIRMIFDWCWSVLFIRLLVLFSQSICKEQRKPQWATFRVFQFTASNSRTSWDVSFSKDPEKSTVLLPKSLVKYKHPILFFQPVARRNHLQCFGNHKLFK